MKAIFSFITISAIIFILASELLAAQTPTATIHGYVQNWLILREGAGGIANAPSPYTSGFRIRRARIGLKGDLSELFSYYTLLDFATAQNILLDFATTAKFDPAINLTVGQFIAPTQLYETSVISSANTECIDISDLATAVYTTMNLDSYRDLGLMASGSLDIVRYRAYFGNGQGRFNYAGKGGIVSRKFGDGLYGGRIDVEPIKNLIVGGHFGRNRQAGTTGTSTKTLDRQTYSALVGITELSGATIRAEYAGGKYRDNPARDSSFTGYTILFAYNVTPRFQTDFRFEWMKEKSVMPNPVEHETIVLGGTYFFMMNDKEIARLQLNYFFRIEESPTPTKDNDLLLAGLQLRF